MCVCVCLCVYVYICKLIKYFDNLCYIQMIVRHVILKLFITCNFYLFHIINFNDVFCYILFNSLNFSFFSSVIILCICPYLYICMILLSLYSGGISKQTQICHLISSSITIETLVLFLLCKMTKW